MNKNRATSDLTRGYAVALLAAAVLSTTAILIRYLTTVFGLPPLVLAFWREAFTTVALLLILAIVRPSLLGVSRPDLRYLFVYGLVFALFNSTWTLSVAVNGAAVATVLVYCSTAFTVILGWWFLGERLDWAKASAVLLSLLGCALVSGVTGLRPLGFTGVVVGVLSGLGYALYSLMGRSATRRGLSPWTTVLYTFGIASGFLLTFNLLGGSVLPGAAAQPHDLFWLGNSVKGWGTLLLLAAGPTLVGFGLYNTSLVYLPSGVANLIATTEPPFTAVMAFFLLGEKMTLTQVFGSLLILSGVTVLRLYENRISRQGGMLGLDTPRPIQAGRS